MIVLVILGYILLAVVSLVLLLVLMLLFIPVTYYSKGDIQEGAGGAVASVGWLFGAVGVRYRIDTALKQHFEIRLFNLIGFRMKSPSRKLAEAGDDDEDPLKKKQEDKKKKGKFTLEKLKTVLKSVERILKRYKPRKLYINATIGFDDAYYTGLMCAGLSALSPVVSSFGKDIRVSPDFNDEIFSGRYYLHGRAVIFFLVWEALRVFFSKSFRKSKIITNNK